MSVLPLFQILIARSLRGFPGIGAMFVFPLSCLWLANELFARLPKSGSYGFLDSTYFAYCAPAAAVACGLPVGLLYGAYLHEDRRAGLVEAFMACPVTRPAILLGYVTACMACGLLSAATMLMVAALSGVSRYSAAQIVEILALVLPITAFYASVSLVLAVCLGERLKLVGAYFATFVTTILVSNLLLPWALLPTWLNGLADLNPLQAGFDAARAAASSPIIWREYDKDAGSLVLLAFCTVCATIVTFQRMSDR